MSRSLPGILQCDFTAPSSLTQLEWIKAALRQRPDVLFIEHPGNVDTIGEVIVAARNKCLVIAAMGRPFDVLIDYLEYLAVPRPAAVAALLGVVDQRIMPRVCPMCSTRYIPKVSELRELRIRCEDPSKLTFAKGNGCANCSGSGRSGRVGIHEVTIMDDELRTMFLQKKPDDIIRQRRLERGMKTFYQSAIHKVVTRRIASTSAIAYCRDRWREPQVWLSLDAETGFSSRTDEPALHR